MEVSCCISNLKYQSNQHSTHRPQQQRGFNEVSRHQESVTEFLVNKNNLPTDAVNPVTLELNLSTQCCLMRFITGDFAS
jgi:hypothetical protein